jgi:hypothetical protein
MSDPRPAADTEPEPLSPEAQAIFARARRSFAISMGLLLFGLIAIGGALVYRATRDSGGSPGADYAIASLRLPQGAEIVSASAGDGLLTLAYRVGPVTSIRIFDGRTGELLREVPLVAE